MVLIQGFDLHEDGLASGCLMYAVSIDVFGWERIKHRGKYFEILKEKDTCSPKSCRYCGKPMLRAYPLCDPEVWDCACGASVTIWHTIPGAEWKENS